MTVAIPDFPDPPNREFPDDFSEKADAVMAAFPGIVAAMNAQNAENNVLSADVNTKHGQVIAAAELVAENIDTIEEAVDNLPNLAAKVSKTGDTMTGHLSVPAGATGAEVPQAQEIYGKSQTEQTVARIFGVTYTNSTGKPIVVTASATTTDADNVLIGYRNGATVVWAWWPDVSSPLNIEFVVFPGATYKLDAYNAADLVVREYR